MYMCGWVPLKSRRGSWITCSWSYMGALSMCVFKQVNNVQRIFMRFQMIY